MGLIREVQNVSYSMNKQERAKRERERIKILQENYNKELRQNLFAEFSQIYSQNDKQTSYNKIILQKDDIIKKVYDIMWGRYVPEKSGDVDLIFLKSPPWDKKWRFEQKEVKRYLYHDFDIIQDLHDIYYKTLTEVEKEFELINKIKNDDLLKQLEQKLIFCMQLDDNKYIIANELQKYDIIYDIIGEITNDKQNQAFLFDNYEKILQKVLKLYKGNITENKMQMKQIDNIQKSKHQKGFISGLLTSYILRDIAKSLPKGMSKKGRF